MSGGGWECPKCNNADTKVFDSRQRGNRRMRRRKCPTCAHRFITTELLGNISELLPLLKPLVIKKSGKTEAFNRQKLMQSVAIAVCKPRRDNVPLDGIVADIEQEIENAEDGALPTHIIGTRVLTALRQYDIIAYLRYASVYKAMNSIDDFKALLDEIKN